MNAKNKAMPTLRGDDEAIEFVTNADLSEFDLSGFKPMSDFTEFQKKDARLEMRISMSELGALKSEAQRLGIPHSALARKFIEQGLKSLTVSG